MEERIAISYILTNSPGFRIRCMDDCYRFWKEVFISGEIHMDDQNAPVQTIILKKDAATGVPVWGMRSKAWEWWQPDVLNTGTLMGTHFLWLKRKSINAWLKKLEED